MLASHLARHPTVIRRLEVKWVAQLLIVDREEGASALVHHLGCALLVPTGIRLPIGVIVAGFI